MRIFKALRILAQAEEFLFEYITTRVATNAIGDKLQAAAFTNEGLTLTPEEVKVLAQLTDRVEKLTTFLRSKL